jgi:hypothetical protein
MSLRGTPEKAMIQSCANRILLRNDHFDLPFMRSRRSYVTPTCLNPIQMIKPNSDVLRSEQALIALTAFLSSK